ncbi:MAG: GTP cyclohydrolase II [Armatimonadetes bacterium]|nr:GTP cyclohydrolase II [Armatimonadota bacterium]
MAISDDQLVESLRSVEEALRRLRAGEFLIVIDDGSPQNTGDLAMAAEFVTPEALNFVMSQARSSISVACTAERLEQLGINLLPRDPDNRGPAWATPVDARYGVTTGDSAEDKATTLRVLLDPKATPHDLVRPGHLQLLQAAPGGVMQRAAHTEAIVDLCRLAGLYPMGVTSQILDPSGRSAELDYVREFARAHGLHIVTIADIIRYRRRTEKLVAKVAEAHLPTVFGSFRVVVYRSLVDDTEFLAVVKGDPSACEAPLVRVHSGCVTGDVLGSLKCDCGWQLHAALSKIAGSDCGVLVYIPAHEGRGIGLANKIRAYHLQERGLDTVQANVALGFPPDARDYGLGAQVLVDLGVRRMRLMSNNPTKFAALQGYGLEVVERVPLEAPTTAYNWEYLLTKRDKLGHMLTAQEDSARDDI